MRLKGLSVFIPGGSSEPQTLSDPILSLPGFQKSNSRIFPAFPAPFGLRSPSFSRLLSVLALLTTRERIAPPPQVLQSQTQMPRRSQENRGKQRQLQSQVPRMATVRCFSWTMVGFGLTKWLLLQSHTAGNTRAEQSSCRADPTGKYKWPAAPPPPKTSAEKVRKVLSGLNA